MTKITTPVVLFTFNRPDNLRAQIEAIGNLSFSKMYFVSDGPRNDNDLILIKECRELYNSFINVDIKIEYANENNWGCKRNFFFHLDKIFQLEEKIIVLEDDCVPTLDFFVFTEWALNFYEKSAQVSLISGSNLVDYKFNENYTCNYSEYINIWGWAGWRDKTWKIFNPYLSIDQLDSLNGKNLNFQSLNFLERLYWKNIFKHSIFSHKIWDFYLQFALFSSNSLSVYPCKNLVYNIGFNETSTHMKVIPDYVLKSKPRSSSLLLDTFKVPDKLIPNKTRDSYLLKTIWGFRFFNVLKICVMNLLRYVSV